MTLLEAVNAVVGFTSPNENIPIKALIDVDLTPETTYVKATHQEKVNTAAIAVLMALKVLAKIDQGGFGVTFNSEEADKTIRFIYSGTGGGGSDPLGGSKPKITSIGNQW